MSRLEVSGPSRVGDLGHRFNERARVLVDEDGCARLDVAPAD